MALLLFLGSWFVLEAILRLKPVESTPAVKQPEAAAGQERPLAGQLMNMSKALQEAQSDAQSEAQRDAGSDFDRRLAAREIGAERHSVD
jgi:hypothetical protein